MEQSFRWKPNSSDGQEIPTFCKTGWFIIAYTAACHSTLSWTMNSGHAFPPYFFKIHFNIMFQFKSRCSKWFISFRFPCTWFFSLQYVPHSLPISATLICFPPKQFICSTNYGIPYNAITHSSDCIRSLAPNSRIPPANVLLLFERPILSPT